MIFRKQKHEWVFIVITIFLVSFVGCSSKPSVESKVAITFYYGAGPEENKSYQKIFSAFKQKHPEIKLKIQFVCGQGYYPLCHQM